MKEEKNIKIKKLINLSVLSFILLTPLIFIGQVNNLKLPNKINFSLKTKAIISELISDKSVVILRVDTSTIVFPSVVYNTSLTDSICLKFHREYFSSMAIHSSDSCLFYYVKSFCFEYLKISKSSKGLKKQTFNGKEYDITISETKGVEYSKYNIWIRSRKHPINM